MTTKQTQYEKLALLFVLNTGEIRKTCELDYNAYFGLLQINIDALKNLYGEWEDEIESRILNLNFDGKYLSLKLRYLKLIIQ